MSGATRAELAEQLRKLGVEMVTAEYDGSGDSGQIGDPEFGGVEVQDDLGDLEMAVQDLFYDLLEEQYGAWMDNEGSFGQFTWNVPTDKIVLRHTTRTESTEEQDL